MKILIDSDYLIENLRNNSVYPQIETLFYSHQVYVSDITILEVFFGFALMPDKVRRKNQIKSLKTVLKFVTMLDIKGIEKIYGKTRKQLKKNPIGGNDTILASQALYEGCAILTNNLRHFNRVQGLKIFQWTKEKSDISHQI